MRKCRGRGAWPNKDDSNKSSSPTVVQAAGGYKKFLDDCNLVDSWSVFETFGQILASSARTPADSTAPADTTAPADSDKLRVLVLKPLDTEECDRVAALGSLVSVQKMELIHGQAREGGN